MILNPSVGESPSVSYPHFIYASLLSPVIDDHFFLLSLWCEFITVFISWLNVKYYVYTFLLPNWEHLSQAISPLQHPCAILFEIRLYHMVKFLLICWIKCNYFNLCFIMQLNRTDSFTQAPKLDLKTSCQWRRSLQKTDSGCKFDWFCLTLFHIV